MILRPGRLSVPALRRPPADRGGAHGARAPACLARAARVRDRLAIRGAVALAAATGRVAEPDSPSRQSLAPDPGPLAVVCLPSSFWRLRRPASSPRGQGSRRIAALLSPAKGHRPSRALDFALRGRDGGLRQGGQGG